MKNGNRKLKRFVSVLSVSSVVFFGGCGMVWRFGVYTPPASFTALEVEADLRPQAMWQTGPASRPGEVR